MLSIAVKATKLKLDTKRITKAMDLSIQKVFRACASEAITAAEPTIPVWSGMSLGALNAKVTKFDGGLSTTGRYLRRSVFVVPFELNPLKTPNKGARLSKHVFSIRGKTYSYKFETSVPQFMIGASVGLPKYRTAKNRISHWARPNSVRVGHFAPWSTFDVMQNVMSQALSSSSVMINVAKFVREEKVKAKYAIEFDGVDEVADSITETAVKIKLGATNTEVPF